MSGGDGSARFIPDIDDFKGKILLYDFYEDIVDDRQVERDDIDEVQVHYKNTKHYMDTMEALFWEECKMQIHKCKATEMMKDNEVIESEQATLMDLEVKEKMFVRLEFERQASAVTKNICGSNDLVLLSQNRCSQPEVAEGDPPIIHLLGFVENAQRQKIIITVRFSHESGAQLRMNEASRVIHEQKAMGVENRSPWWMTKITKMTSAIREYEALLSLPHIPLRRFIVNQEKKARTADVNGGLGGGMAEEVVEGGNAKLEIPVDLVARLDADYNSSQRLAVEDSRKVVGITLVQGPPGTGKTATIRGILSMLLNAGFRKSAKAEVVADEISDSEPDEIVQERKRRRVEKLRVRMPWIRGDYVAWSDEVEQQLTGPGHHLSRRPYPKLGSKDICRMPYLQDEDNAPQKVLVCGPSNAAVDEVVRRMVSQKVFDHRGERASLDIVRLGPNVHPDLKEWSLEKIVEKRLKAKEKGDSEEEKQKVLMQARLVCCTLSIAGCRELVGFPGDFDTVIIDEASQAVEVNTLISLKLGCKRLVMVGDPQQLPATCFSEVAKYYKYDQSLFQRLEKSKHKVNMLQEQYRMHPAISKFPSTRFYGGRLLNFRNQEEYERDFPAPWSRVSCFGSHVFFHVKGTMTASTQSFSNDDEADVVIQLFKAISSLYPEVQWREKIGIISPYGKQVQNLRKRFCALFDVWNPKDPCPVEVGTVDGFQGREKDVIILSAVRTGGGIGFLRDQRRMNVSFTRARTNLWVVGNADTLGVNEDWEAFIALQCKNNSLLTVSKPFDTWVGRHLSQFFSKPQNSPIKGEYEECFAKRGSEKPPFLDAVLGAEADADLVGKFEQKVTEEAMAEIKRQNEDLERGMRDNEEDESLGDAGSDEEGAPGAAGEPVVGEEALFGAPEERGEELAAKEQAKTEADDGDT